MAGPSQGTPERRGCGLPRTQATGRSLAGSGSAGTVPSLAPHLGALTGYLEALMVDGPETLPGCGPRPLA